MDTIQTERHAAIRVGVIDVIALADGDQDIPVALFADADPAEIRRLSQAAGFGPDAVPIAVNVFAVRTGGRLHLVDTGSGPARGPHVGHLPAALAAAGIDPSAVDVVLMTHLHGDHAGGLRRADGTAAFPSAELWLAEAEAAFWLDPALPGRAPERMQPTIANAAASLALYADRTTRFAPGAAIAPGITAVDLPGHTPGQTGYLVESAGERLLIWADIIHVEAFQFPHPEWTIGFDIDGPAAAATRRRIFARAVAEALPVAGMHLGFPGVGVVVPKGDVYAFVARMPG